MTTNVTQVEAVEASVSLFGEALSPQLGELLFTRLPNDMARSFTQFLLTQPQGSLGGGATPDDKTRTPSVQILRRPASASPMCTAPRCAYTALHRFRLRMKYVQRTRDAARCYRCQRGRGGTSAPRPRTAPQCRGSIAYVLRSAVPQQHHPWSRACHHARHISPALRTQPFQCAR